jgi:hypothetical protein
MVYRVSLLHLIIVSDVFHVCLTIETPTLLKRIQESNRDMLGWKLFDFDECSVHDTCCSGGMRIILYLRMILVNILLCYLTVDFTLAVNITDVDGTP